MSSNLFSHPREAVRVKVKKCEANVPPEWRKFSVDPQITSLEVLYSLLAKAFEIKSDFSIKYKAYDPAGNEIYLPVLSDWDLDAAFLRIHNLSIQTATEPCLILQIDIKPFTEVKEWEPETPTSSASASIDSSSSAGASSGAREIMSPLQQSIGASQKYVQHMQNKLPGLIMNQMEKTFSMVQKAFNLNEETMVSLPPRVPLSDAEFRLFLDALGQVQRSDDLRKVIFFGGIEPSLRRVVWKHILNVYPSGMNGHQRMEYMRRKADHYYKLRDVWKNAIKQGCVAGELAYVTSMVKKDVLRTDRHHSFYAGNDDNQNIASLFNILTTYALNHPSVSYCQGMSDIASPLLVTMNDEAQAYICFCAIMARVKCNFMLDGIAMTQKFTHLTEALSFYDPVFWDYLKSQQADDLLFCYRWLLLELKREFPFDDALRMLEVQWSSLKYETSSDKELSLFEKEFVPIMESSAPTTSSSISSSFGNQPISPSYLLVKPRENAYTKICALRRQSSTASLSSLSSSLGASSSTLDNSRRLNQSLDDNISRHAARRRRRASSKAHQSLDETKMLMLIEGLESNKSGEIDKDEHEEHNARENGNEEDDDEVFAVESAAPGPEGEGSQFDFHPTNPFKTDAEAHTEKESKVCLEKATDGAKREEAPTEQATKATTELPKGIAKLQNKSILSNYNAMGNIVSKQLANASTVSESMKRVGSMSGGHFKELKEKLAATNRLGMSFDEGNEQRPQQKLVKNFNEFLNFASANKSRIADKLATTVNSNSSKIYDKNKTSKSPSPTHKSNAAAPPPLVQLTKTGLGSSLDDSEDSFSAPDTTWSGSTAATAIQQSNNYSSHSLHLELNSLTSSTLATPDKTPTTDRHLEVEDGSRSPPLRKTCNESSLTPDDSQDQEYYPMTTAITRELRLESENLDRQLFGEIMNTKANVDYDIGYEKLDKDSLDLMEDLKENEIIKCPDASELLMRRRNRDAKVRSSIEPLQHLSSECKGVNVEVSANETTASADEFKLNPFIDDNLMLDTSIPTFIPCLPNSNSLPEVLVPISADTSAGDGAPDELGVSASDEAAFSKSPQRVITNGQDKEMTSIETGNVPSTAAGTTTTILAPVLPPPNEFGGGNPFLMFLCLTLLLQHRNTIIKSNMDYNEIAMHFDKMVRKHNVTRVLNQARRMYIDYLKRQSAYKRSLEQMRNSEADAAGDQHRRFEAKSDSGSSQLQLQQ